MLTEERLPGGLVLAVEPRGHAPVVALWLRLGVGARYEVPGQEGAAHFLEHMLFKGSARLDGSPGLLPGEIGQRMDALGADLNAWTSHDETVVHCVLPRRHAQEAIALMGEMVFRTNIDPREVARERAVILEELSQGRDDPSRMLAEAMARRIWGRHPYGRPVLGTLPSVRGLSVAALVAFHQRWYHPENAHLVAVGDMDPAEVRAAALAQLGRRRADPGAWAGVGSAPCPEPGQRDLRFVRVEGVFEEQILELALRIPGHGHPDLPALDVLCSVLGEGASAILPARLHTETGVAHSAWAATEVGQQGGILVCGASPAADAPDPSLEALGRELAAVRDQGVPVDAFQRARATILADRAYSEETAEGRAATLSWYLGHHGSTDAERAYRGRIEALRLAEVDEAARRYLRLERATVGVIGQRQELGRGDAEALLRPTTPAMAPTRSRASARRAASEVVRRVHASGVRVLIEPLPDASVTALRVVGLGGSLLETPATAGHARAWADLLTEGAGPLDTGSFAQTIEGLSGSLGGSSSLSVAGLAASFPSERFSAALPVLLLPLIAPRFDEAAVRRIRSSMEDEVRTRGDSGATLAWEALFELAFPGHPYRLPPGGTPHSVEAIDPAAMRRYHRRFTRARNLVVAVSGAVSPAAVMRAIEPMLAALAGGEVSPPAEVGGLGPRRRRLLRGAWSQAQLVVGFPGCGFLEPDRPALDVLATILGSAGGRLFLRLREEAGLSYDIQASHLAALQGGVLSCSMGTAHDRLREARRALWRAVDELRRDPPGRDELDRAIASMVGASAQDLQRTSVCALRMAQDERFGLDGRRYRRAMDDVAGVTLDEVLAVLDKYIRRDRALQVIATRSAPNGRG
ncbi:MAG: pitrilysin family protein [Pseudomonadota bacterium]